MSKLIKCLSCNTEKTREEYSFRNYAQHKYECKECQLVRKRDEAVAHAKQFESTAAERKICQEIERKAKIRAEVDKQMTSKTPYKFTKQTPELKARRDELMYNKEIEEINSKFDL